MSRSVRLARTFADGLRRGRHAALSATAARRTEGPPPSGAPALLLAAAAAAGAGAAGLASCHGPPPPELGPPAIRKGYVDTAIGQVHYRRSGPWPPQDASCVVLLVHQVPSHGEMFEQLMRALPAVTFLAPDMPGFGGTADPEGPATMELYSACCLGALDALGVENCGVLGHHFGAGVALQFADDHPERVTRLMLSGPTFFDGLPRIREATVKTYAAPRVPVADGAHASAEWARLRAKEQDIPLWLTQREFTGAMRSVRYPEAVLALLTQDFAAQIKRVSVPIMLTTGPNDVLKDAVQETLKLGVQAESRWFEHAGAYVFDRQVADVAAVVAEFFGR